MQPLELLLTAIALAMDAFAVAIATGVALRCASLRQTLRLAWHFGLFQALMPICGWLLGATVRHWVQAWAHWVAFGLLAYIGSKMIVEALRDQGDGRAACDPTRGLTLVMLSVATSIDALAVGLSLSVLRVSVWWPALVIGVVALAFTALGMRLGRTVARARSIGQLAGVLGGVVLVGIGVKILADHGALPFFASGHSSDINPPAPQPPPGAAVRGAAPGIDCART